MKITYNRRDQLMLFTEHLEQFDREGYLLLSDLIPNDIIDQAEKAMWQTMGMEADEPGSWDSVKRPFLSNFYIENMSNERRIELFGVTNPDLLACCTPEYRSILKQLADRAPTIPHCKCEEPDGVWAMNQFPIVDEWRVPPPHLDGFARDLRLDPGTFRVSSLTYLTDANSHQGTTVIFPEGPERIREFRRKNPDFSNHVRDIRSIFHTIELGEPLEIVAKKGDILFFHHLLPHTGSFNNGNTPRFAIRFMCLCYDCRPWQKRGEWNIWMP